MTKDLWLVVLGSVLAFLGGMVSFFMQAWWNKRSQKKVVLEFLVELMTNFNRVIPRILETYEKSGVLWNDLLNQLTNDLNLYERNREHSILIRHKELRAAIWDWFSSVGTTVNMSLGLNNMIGNNPNNQWAKDEVRKQIEKFKGLKSEASSLVEKLRR